LGSFRKITKAAQNVALLFTQAGWPDEFVKIAQNVAHSIFL
jgi:hypothetical protein